MFVLGHGLLVIKAGLLLPAGLRPFGNIKKEKEKDIENSWLVPVCPGYLDHSR
jgi:hypothetical protein